MATLVGDTMTLVERLANILKHSDLSFSEQVACVASLEIAAWAIEVDGCFHRRITTKYGTQTLGVLLKVGEALEKTP